MKIWSLLSRITCVILLVGCAEYAFASEFTLVEFGTTNLDGTGGGPAPVYGSTFGPTASSWTGSSTSTDGNYVQLYSGSGLASIGSLHGAVSEAVTCVSAACSPYALPSFSGSATYQPGITALVWWNDIITVSPGPGLAALNFVFQVDGTFSQSGSANSSITSAQLVGEACAATEALCTGGPPPTPRNITKANLTGNGQVTLSLTPWALGQPFDYEFILGLTASVSPNVVGMQGYINGNSSASADFSDTVQLVTVEPVDSQGNFVPGTTITSASGDVLPLEEAPEPSTGFFMIPGLLLLGFGAGGAVRR